MSDQPPEVVVVGSANLDLRIELARLPVRGETVLGGPVEQGPGGKGLNQAVALARLGRRTALVAALGADDAAAELERFLIAEGVTALLARSDIPTGRALVLVDAGGDSTIVVSPGANGSLRPDVLTGACGDAIASAAAVVCQLEIPVDTVTAAVGRASGLRVLNPAPGAALPDELLAEIDVLTPNRSELGLVAGAPRPSTHTEIDDTARALRRRLRPGALVVVTLGSEGSLVVADDLFEYVPAAAVAPGALLDPTGAGDTFTAALVDALLDGRGPIEAAGWASAAAAVTVSRPGAATATPHRADLGLR